MSTTWWRQRKSQIPRCSDTKYDTLDKWKFWPVGSPEEGITEVIKINPLGTINVCTNFLCNPFNSLERPTDEAKNRVDSQSEVSVGLLEDPLWVEVIGSEVFGPADDGVDLLRQLLGLLLQLLVLLHTETQQWLTNSTMAAVCNQTRLDYYGPHIKWLPLSQCRPHLQKLSARAEVVTFGSIVQHPLDGLDLQLGILRKEEWLWLG